MTLGIGIALIILILEQAISPMKLFPHASVVCSKAKRILVVFGMSECQIMKKEFSDVIAKIRAISSAIAKIHTLGQALALARAFA